MAKTTVKELKNNQQKKETQDNPLYLRRRIRDLEAGLNEKRIELGEKKEFETQVLATLTAADPYPVYRYKAGATSKTQVVPVFKLSDWHIGEVVQENEVEGFNKFNWDIAQRGMVRITEDVLRWAEVQRRAYPINECAVFCEGDFVSGDIHDELKATNEFPLPVQATNAGLLLGEVLHMIAPHFKVVTVYQVKADNHGRLVKRPQAKQKSANNMNHVVYEVANAFVRRCKNVRVVETEGAKLLAKVNGWNFLVEHGDGVKAWMGIPHYGIERQEGREARKRMNTDKGFHYHSIGHWHVPNILAWRTIINGSLSGTSEFDHIAGRHADPSQVAFLVHRKHGLFNPTAFKRLT